MYNVIIFLSTYNGEKYIKKQLESLKNQEKVNIKIYIRDDGSTDNTLNIIEDYKDMLNINIIKGKNIGPAKSFIELMNLCKEKADFYALCDQDDYWEKNKIISAINFMNDEKQSIPKLYYSNVKIVNKNLEYIGDGIINKFNDNFKLNFINNPAIGCTIVFNDKLKENLKFPEETIMHDWWLLKSCMCLNGKIYKDNNSYIKYRQHENNVIGAKKKRKNVGVIKKYIQSIDKYSADAKEILILYENIIEEKKKRIIKEDN